MNIIVTVRSLSCRKWPSRCSHIANSTADAKQTRLFQNVNHCQNRTKIEGNGAPTTNFITPNVVLNIHNIFYMESNLELATTNKKVGPEISLISFFYDLFLPSPISLLWFPIFSFSSSSMFDLAIYALDCFVLFYTSSFQSF